MRSFNSTRRWSLIVQYTIISFILVLLLTSRPPALASEVLLSLSMLVLLCWVILGVFLTDKAYRRIHMLTKEQERFSTDIAHDLRTPTAALRTLLEVSQIDPALQDPAVANVFERGLRQVKSIQSLTDSLLELSQYSTQKTSPLIATSLDAAIADAMHRVQPLADDKSVRIKYAQSSHTVKAIPDELCRLVVILLDNAIKYSPRHSCIRIATCRHRNTVTFSVTDEGKGISPEDQKQLFKRFYRTDTSRVRSGTLSGFGLGLAIAQAITTRHRGNISVESELGKGTTFIVTLKSA